MNNLAARVGATAYALWSLLHIALEASRLSERASASLLAEGAGRLAQGHWTLIYLGVFGLILSFYNWKNNRTAYWITLFVVSAQDIGFLFFPVLYGGTGLPGTAVGPGLWLTGLVFTSIAYVSRRAAAVRRVLFQIGTLTS